MIYLFTVIVLCSLFSGNINAQGSSGVKAVYTVGLERGGSRHWDAKVWVNGEKLYTLTDGSRNSIAVKVAVSGGKVYVFGWERGIVPLENYKVWCDGKELFSISSVDHKCGITSMAVSSGVVYLGGKVYKNGRWVAAVWKNGNILYELAGKSDAGIQDLFIDGGTIYSVVSEGDGYVTLDNCVIKVFRNEQQLYKLTKGRNSGNATSLFVSGKDVFVSGYETKKGVAASTVWKNGKQLYRFGDGKYATYVKSVYASDGDVYAAGYLRDADTLVSSGVWKNGELLYDLGESHQALSVFVAEGRVYVTGNRIEEHELTDLRRQEGRVWCDGKELYHIGYGTIAESSCVTDAGRELVAWGLQGTGDNRDLQMDPDDLIVMVGQGDKSSRRNIKAWVNGFEAYNIGPSDKGRRSDAIPLTASISGKNLYVFGYERDENIKRHYKLWKNKKILYNLFDSLDVYVSSAFISGDNVYVAGSEVIDGKHMATLWKNGNIQYRFNTVKEAAVSSAVVSGGNIYSVMMEKVAGDENRFIIRVMKNDEELYLLNDGKITGVASRIVVSGDDIYVAGHQRAGDFVTPVIWKNGAEHLQISNGTDHLMVTSIVINEGDVYACGHTIDADKGKPLKAKAWKNNTELYSFDDATELTSIFVYNGSVYISGMEEIDKKSIGKLWKDGMLLYQINSRNIYDDTRIQSVIVMDRKELQDQ